MSNFLDKLYKFSFQKNIYNLVVNIKSEVIIMVIPSEDVIIHAISHEVRREILEMLRMEPKTFSELLSHFDISTTI